MENVETFKTLSNEYRLKILTLLKDPQKQFYNETKVDEVETGVCVGEIQKLLNLTQSTTSHYLSMLEKDNLLIATRIGKWTYYRRNEEMISDFKNFILEEL